MNKANKAILLAICLSLAGCNAQNNNSTNSSQNNIVQDVDVIVIAGQSNAEGCTSWTYLNEEQQSKYREGFENTLIRFNCNEGNNYSRNFVNVKLGQGHQNTNFGPEIGMAEYFEENYEYLNKKIYLVKYAYGGTALYDKWRSPSSTILGEKPGELYTGLINYCNESIEKLNKQGFNPTIRAICWMQGESDAGSVANSYKNLENNFINDVCSDLAEYNSEDTIKFIDAGISQSPVWQNYQIINNAKKANAELDPENRYYIDTILEGLTYDLEPASNPDFCHYDSLSMVELGRLFAQTIIEGAIIEQD